MSSRIPQLDHRQRAILDALRSGKKYFSELLLMLAEQMSKDALSKNLRLLEAWELVSRKVDVNTRPPRTAYELVELAQETPQGPKPSPAIEGKSLAQRISIAKERIGVQRKHLTSSSMKLKKRESALFKEIVELMKKKRNQKALTLANVLAEIMQLGQVIQEADRTLLKAVKNLDNLNELRSIIGLITPVTAIKGSIRSWLSRVYTSSEARMFVVDNLGHLFPELTRDLSSRHNMLVEKIMVRARLEANRRKEKTGKKSEQ